MKARIVLVAMLCMLLPQVGTAGGVWVSKRGLFTVSYESALQPIEINQMHHWVLHIEGEGGEPVTGAHVEVIGGMPVKQNGHTEDQIITDRHHYDLQPRSRTRTGRMLRSIEAHPLGKPKYVGVLARKFTHRRASAARCVKLLRVTV